MMKKKLGVLFVVLFSTVSAVAQLNASPTTWNPVAIMDGSVFPSFLLTVSNVRESNTFAGKPIDTVGIELVAPIDNASVKLVVEIQGIAHPTTYEVKIPKRGVKYGLFPKIRWRYDVLASMKQSGYVNAFFTLFINDEMVGRQGRSILVRSVNDAPFGYLNDTGNWIDSSFIFAGFVNEEHPWIDQLLREAKEAGTVDSFVGYKGSRQDVYKQVAAVWNVLQRRGFRYSNLAQLGGTSPRIATQYVRFVSDSISVSQANCIDGSILFASILRRIGIDPLIVIIPGHAFVGFYQDSTHQTAAFLETTMLGNTNLASFAEDRSLSAAFNNLLGLPSKNKASFLSFLEAYRKGDELYNLHSMNLKAANPRYRVIDISALRKVGFKPIPN